MKQIFTHNEIQKIAQAVVQKIMSQPTGQSATVVALQGDLGAGKTTLSKAIAAELGVKESVSSPTFVIMKYYPLKEKKYTQLIHIDAYRLKDAQELRILGWQELIQNPTNLILIEWPENVSEIIPADAMRVSLSHHSQEEREIVVSG